MLEVHFNGAANCLIPCWGLLLWIIIFLSYTKKVVIALYSSLKGFYRVIQTRGTSLTDCVSCLQGLCAVLGPEGCRRCSLDRQHTSRKGVLPGGAKSQLHHRQHGGRL